MNVYSHISADEIDGIKIDFDIVDDGIVGLAIPIAVTLAAGAFGLGFGDVLTLPSCYDLVAYPIQLVLLGVADGRTEEPGDLRKTKPW